MYKIVIQNDITQPGLKVLLRTVFLLFSVCETQIQRFSKLFVNVLCNIETDPVFVCVRNPSYEPKLCQHLQSASFCVHFVYFTEAVLASLNDKHSTLTE